MTVWDPVVRLAHWTLVASVALAGLSTVTAMAGFIGALHTPAGYLAFGVVLGRLLWGALGSSRYARFGQFLRAPRATWRYARDVVARRAPRYLGHNPLGAWMIVALMACVALLALTGWLYTSERFWADETVETIHRVAAWTLLVLAAMHVAGVVLTSLSQHENLIRAMCDGRKPAPREGDVA